MDVDNARVRIVLPGIAWNCQISIDKVLYNLNLALSSLQVTYLILSATIYFADARGATVALSEIYLMHLYRLTYLLLLRSRA